MSKRNRNHRKFTPPRKRRPSLHMAEAAAEPAAELLVPKEETVVEPAAAEPLVPEEDVASEPAAESLVPEEDVASEPVAEELPVPEQTPAAPVLRFGEETSAARELPDYFFDEEDEEEPEVPVPVRKKEKKKKKNAGKKKRDKNNRQLCATRPVQVGSLMIGDGIPKICIPVVGETEEEVLQQAEKAAASHPDLVEWRADAFSAVLNTTRTHVLLKQMQELFGDTPILFTYRTSDEGGSGRISWEQYTQLLTWAAGLAEVALVDVEAMGLDVDTEGLIRAIHEKETPVIASVHYIEGTPGKKEFREAVRFLQASGGDILKVAAAAHTSQEVLDLMAWTRRRCCKCTQPLITVSMGDIGRLSRISGGITGSAVTFGCAGTASAPGQIPAEAVRAVRKLLEN